MGFGALLFLLLVILASVAIVGVILRSSRARAAAERSGELTLFDLSVGDIVQHELTDWVVEDRLVYRQGDFSWLEFLLRDEDRSLWL